MNVQDVITRVRRLFGDEAAVQVTNDDVIRWINDAQVNIVRQNDGALQTSTTMNLVANQSTYALPADLFILRSLRYKFSSMQSYSSLNYKSMQEFDDAIDGWDGNAFGSGYPVFFTKYDNSVTLFPTPQEASVAGLKILYSAQPTVVDDVADTFSLPLIYHDTILQYCMWQASLMDEDHEVGMIYKAEFQEGVDKLAIRENSDPTQFYQTITTLAEDM